MGLRGDAIAQFDWSVGQILEALERNGLDDNTLVILTSDNGPVLDDGYCDEAEEKVGRHSPTGHLRGGKYSSFEGGTTVPMIIRLPGKTKKGHTTDMLISQIDFFRSLSLRLGARLPDGAAPDSRDWRVRKYVVEQAYDHTLSIRDSRWKYISPSDGTPLVPWGTGIETGHIPEPQLFSLDCDRGEMRNVAAEHPDIVKKMQKALAEEINPPSGK